MCSIRVKIIAGLIISTDLCKKTAYGHTKIMDPLTIFIIDKQIEINGCLAHKERHFQKILNSKKYPKNIRFGNLSNNWLKMLKNGSMKL